MFQKRGNCVSMLAILAVPVSAWGLDLGDPAPSLQIETWVQGKPISLDEERGNNVVVIDFFSVACRPSIFCTKHLNELHRKYQDSQVKFVSVSGDGADWIELTFEPQIEAATDYRLAKDNQHQTMMSYLGGVGAIGVPHAFVIDREGRIAWHGTPDPRIDAVIESVVAGTFDIEAEKERRIKRAANWRSFMQALDGGRVERAEAALKALAPLESQESLYLSARYVQAMNADNVAAATLLGKYALVLEDRAPELNEWAWSLLTDDQTAGRYSELALHVARKAYEASGPDEYAVADTLALALFETGSVTEAVKLQRHALDLAEKNGDNDVATYRKTLRRYEKALADVS